MKDSVKNVCLSLCEIGVSAGVGAAICAGTPLSLLMLPVCAASSAISAITNAIFKNAFRIGEHDVGMKLAIKSVSVLIGSVVAAGALSLILMPVSLEIALIIFAVVGCASVFGAFTAFAIEEGPEIFSGNSSWSFHIGSSSPRYWRQVYSSGGRGRTEYNSNYSSVIGSGPARGMGDRGVKARGW